MDPDPHLDPLAKGTDPRIRIRTKMSRTVLRIRIRDPVPILPLDPGWVEVSIRIRCPNL
jgi:hypothetical protein